MREINFRGKSVMSGKWFYGSLIKDKDRCWISVQEEHWNLGVFDNFDVRPETVGQYTGLKDKNGREIYEGDVLRVVNNTCHITPDIFLVNDITKYDEMITISNLSQYEEIEVIGNIHENPELLGDSR